MDGTAAGFQTLPVSHHWQPMGPRPQRGRGRKLLVIHTACIGHVDKAPSAASLSSTLKAP